MMKDFKNHYGKQLENFDSSVKGNLDCPRILITLPPFNAFGLESELESANVPFFDLKSEFYNLIKNSEESIYICSPFIDFDGIKSFLTVLTSKAKMGVEINLISREISFSNSKYKEIKKINDYFKSNNAPINIRDYHYHSKNRITSSVHAKLIISDRKYAYIGSGELRKNSFEKNFEVGVILDGERGNQMALIFEELFSVSQEINFD